MPGGALVKMDISVIIPAYNCQNTIERCINSILDQEKTILKEIIIVDDGSNDDTSLVVEKIKKKDNRIKLFRTSNNGVSSARNYGIQRAQGKYIMFVDSDDEVKQGLLKAMSSFIGKYDLVVSGIELHQNAGISCISIKDREYLSNELIMEYGKSIPTLLLNGPCAKLYKRQVILDNKITFNKNLSLGEDTLFVFEYLKYSKKIKFIDYVGYVYYQLAPTSLMNKVRKDGYVSAKFVYRELIEDARIINFDTVPENLEIIYKNVLMTYIRKMFYNCNYFSKEEIVATIKDYVDDTIVQKYAHRKTKQNYFQKIINKLIIKRWYRVLSFVIKGHVCVRGI